jgi:hypothetical protein
MPTSSGTKWFGLVGLAAAALSAACAGSPSNSLSPAGPTALSPQTSSADPWSGRPDEPPPPVVLKGRFTGGGFQIGDVRVTRGFTIHCDLLLSNNLQVNWGGNQFHMNEHTTTVECSDNEELQAPPAAPVDTIVGVGSGRYNGVDGYTIEFKLVDAGEPGTSDRAALRIFNASGDVLNLSEAVLGGGNIQAHFDQPHKN